MTMPSIKQALDLYDNGLAKMKEEQPKFYFYQGRSFKSHCSLVACCAEIISSRIADIDGQKAYMMGLLHDYGKMVEDADNINRFHGLTGYEAMNELGYDELAKTCLTHTFVNKDFKVAEFNYPQKDLQRVKKLLSKMEYDDYDRLIQLCDLLVLGFDFKNIKERMIFVKNKYHLNTIIIKNKYREALRLKRYFDEKCGCDIYRLLGVN